MWDILALVSQSGWGLLTLRNAIAATYLVNTLLRWKPLKYLDSNKMMNLL